LIFRHGGARSGGRSAEHRGGHGIPEKIVIEELKAAGLTVEKIVEDWPEGVIAFYL